MNQVGKRFTSEEADSRKWIGGIIIAVILGEAVWNLIVSVMNNLVVPWLGDVMGPSSGLPTSFTQRPYDYPDLFVSVLESCIAGIVALILNYFFQQQRMIRVKLETSSVPTAPVKPAPAASQAAAPAAMIQATSPLTPPAGVAKPDPATPSAPVAAASAAAPPFVALESAARAVAVAPPAPPVTNSAPPTPQPDAKASELNRPKEVYYNIVGEPMPPDED